MFLGLDPKPDVYQANAAPAAEGAERLRQAMRSLHAIAPTFQSKNMEAKQSVLGLAWLKRSRRRRFTNPEAIIAAAQKTQLKLHTVQAEQDGLASTIAAMDWADIVFGMHGADLGNLIYLPMARGSKRKVVVQLMNWCVLDSLLF